MAPFERNRYDYPGVWERYSETELLCNYWQFLGIDNSELLFEDEIDDTSDGE
ncbi:hypothetical protein [[Haemophilus] ducreyi]|uniref:hypothetical protein n=1 Tax=Haemophilus ducreyi TaxID=730 RepID=UPI0002DDB09D|nr:hypothetical protein [[Haemophilus] ducreyi]